MNRVGVLDKRIKISLAIVNWVYRIQDKIVMFPRRNWNSRIPAKLKLERLILILMFSNLLMGGQMLTRHKTKDQRDMGKWVRMYTKSSKTGRNI